MFNIDRKKINSILDYFVIIMLLIITITKGGYYKRDALIGICIINIVFVIKIILNIKDKMKCNVQNYILLFLSFMYYIPLILSNTATVSGSLNAFFKVFTCFSIFCIVQNLEDKKKFKTAIIVFGVIIGILGIDEMTFRILDTPLKAIGSGYLDEYTGTLSSVIQYANVTGIIFVIASLLVLEKISNNKKVEKSSNIKIIILDILYLFFVILTFLTQSKMSIVLVIISGVIYKIINKEYKDLVKIGIFYVIALLCSLNNLSRFAQYFTSFDSTKTRFMYYQDAFKIFSKNIFTILFGQGGNAFRMLYETVQDSFYVSMEVHSLFMQVLLESGICGLFSVIFLLIYTLVKGKNKNAKLMLITLCIFSLFDIFFTYTIMLFIFSIILAFCEVETREIKKCEHIILLILSAIITLGVIKINLGYILEPKDTENANNTFEQQESIIKRCELAIMFDPYDMDIRESYTKACMTYLDIMDIKKEIYSQDNEEKREEIVSKIYNNVCKELEYEENNKYAIDDYVRVTIKYVDYLAMANYDFNILEEYEFYLEQVMEKMAELEEKHPYNDACKIIIKDNYDRIYSKYTQLNYILHSEYIEQVIDIIEEKENINL